MIMTQDTECGRCKDLAAVYAEDNINTHLAEHPEALPEGLYRDSGYTDAGYAMIQKWAAVLLESDPALCMDCQAAQS